MPAASFTHIAGANGTRIVAGKAVWKRRRGESGRKGLRRWAGWHWHVFALHLEAHYSYILCVQRKMEIHVVRTA
jgi:hypothetical protein